MLQSSVINDEQPSVVRLVSALLLQLSVVRLGLLLILSVFRLLRPVNVNVPLNLLLEQLTLCSDVDAGKYSEVSWLLLQLTVVSAEQLLTSSVVSALL